MENHGESSTPTHQPPAVLFPAYATTSVQGTKSLFPAYSSVQEAVENQDEKREWLQNSSFTESAFKQVCSQFSGQPDSEETSKDVPASEIKKISIEKLKKDKSHKKKKYKKCPDPSNFAVPESESILSQLKNKTFLEETGLSLERAFRTDSTRDLDNLMFETFERTKIASYHSYPKIPIGLSPEEFLKWTLSLPKKKEKQKPSRYFSKNVLKLLKAISVEKIHAVKESLDSSSRDYIPIQSSVNYINQPDKNGKSRPNFVNVSSSWKTKTSKSEESANEPNSVEAEDSELREQVIYYNKKVSEEPNNIELWIDFVDFQDMLFASKNTEKSNAYSESSLTEKKIAILDKALSFNPTDVRLNVMKLKLSENLFSSDKLTSMWEDLIFFNPNNPKVWQQYLLYSLSNLTTFNVANILRLYSKCLRTLSKVSEGEIESHKASDDIVHNMLAIFNHLCYILNSCGYTEKAIAAFQAVVELNLFCDPCIENLPIGEKIVCLEPFWDSGAPRIGEKNALGWAATVQQKKISFDHISTDSDLNNMEDEILAKKLTLPETWLQFERLRENCHWLPWKPNPEYDQTSDDVDDVDRTVSFEDVSKFLFCVREEEHKFSIVLQFIMFLGFNPHSLGCYKTSKNLIDNLYSLDDYEIISYTFQQSNLIHPLADPLPRQTLHWNQERYDFINNIFQEVLEKFSPKYKTLLTFLCIKFRHHYAVKIKDCKIRNDVSDVKKIVKGILKKNENRNCLLLWFEYIYIEWLIDKSSAVKTFRALLLSSTNALSSGSMQLQELWYFLQAFFELLIIDAQNSFSKILSPNEILWILTHVASKEKYISYSDQEIKPTMILKTVSAFKSALEKELNSLDSMTSALCYCCDPLVYSVINCAKCFVYFQYFSQGYETAVQVYENVISFVDSKISSHFGKYISEQMHVFQANFLNFHTWNSTVSIKPLQIFLRDSVEKYPHNSQLLFLLVKLKSASSVISTTRRFLSQLLKNHHKSHPATWLFTLLAEFAICCTLLLQNDTQEGSLKEIISGMGINWRIRSLYEKMLHCDSCASISILWRSYLKFEVMTQNIERAKGVFHRGLQNCGWSKELLMDAVEYFPDELKQVLAFMTEKQIRIHTPLEEVTLLMEHAVTDS